MQTGAEDDRGVRIGLSFNPRFLLLAVLLFATEVMIATRMSHVGWVRAYLGDVLVVVLLYAAARSVLRINDHLLLALVFAFACAIEIAQAFSLAERLGFVRGDLMYTVIGNTFSWGDIACYAVGCGVVAGLVLLWHAHARSRKFA